MTSETSVKRGKFHYAWAILGGGFATQAVLILTLLSVPMNMSYIVESLGINTASAGMMVSVYGLCYAGFSFAWGYLADRVGGRLTITIAGIVASLGLMSFGLFVNSLTSAVLLYAVAGFGAAGIYSATVPKIIAAWFVPNRRGRAMSFVVMGGAVCGMLGGLFIPTLSATFGWDQVFIGAGCIGVALSLLVHAILRNSPADKGLAAFGSHETSSGEAALPSNKVTAAKGNYPIILKRKVTWQLCLMFVLYEFAFMCDDAFLVLSVVQGGFTPAEAGRGFTIRMLSLMIGLVTWGALSDRFERKWILSAACFWWGALALIYSFVWGTESLAMLYVVLFLMGFGLGTMPMVLSIFADHYEPNLRGTANGFIASVALLGRFGGPVIAGAIADATGVISSAYVFAGVMMALAGAVCLSLPRLREARASAANLETA